MINYEEGKGKKGKEHLLVLTDEGRTPPNAVYKESFPTGIPIPWHKF